jgi:hypothetical protein
VKTLTEYKGKFNMVLLDDGSPSPASRALAKNTARKWGAEFIQHDANKGIPAGWNSLTRSGDEEVVVLLNDDIEVLDKHWLTIGVDFLLTSGEAGMKIGPVGWPTINRDPVSGVIFFDEKDTWPEPGLCGAPTGCCFLFTRKLFDEIGGFWEELISFYEETTFGCEAARLGYYPVQLGNPTMAHNHSITFASNPELQVIDLEPELREAVMSSPMTKQRYEEWAKAWRLMQDGPPQPMAKWVHDRLNGRMGRARAMYAQKYCCEDLIDGPQIETHERYVIPLDKSWKEAKIRWLESDGEVLTRRTR